MRILGIDPGTSLIGYGMIEQTPSGLVCLNYGILKTGKNLANKDRVLTVFNFFEELIKKYRPDKAGVEKLFYFKNAKTIIQVSEMRGVILLALHKNGIAIEEFTPLQVKQAVSNYGRAEKTQIQKIVSLILKLKEMPKPDDVADALAVAICAANTARFA